MHRTLSLLGWRKVETQLGYSESGEVASESTSVWDLQGSAPTLVSSTLREHRWDSHGRLSESWLDGQLLAVFGYDANGLPSTASSPGGLEHARAGSRGCRKRPDGPDSNIQASPLRTPKILSWRGIGTGDLQTGSGAPFFFLGR